MKLCLLWIIAKGVAVTFAFSPDKWEDKKDSMVWLDGRSRLKPDNVYYIERFYDRIVNIYYLKPDQSSKRLYKHETTGVIISSSQILTTFNPYRELSKRSDSLRQMRVKVAFRRRMDNRKLVDYEHLQIHKVVCARQIIPESGYEIRPTDLRHGVNSPLHDLMVLRLDKEIPILYTYTVWTIGPKVKVNMKEHNPCENERCSWYGSSPRLTKLARLEDKLLGTDMILVSLGHLNDEHIFENRYLEKTELTHEEKIIADCDEWLPREWGHFICLKNLWKFEGIASGAMLFEGETLFGLGGFVIWKGNYADENYYLNNINGILVFTDVRPYENLLNKTCSKHDQETAQKSRN